MTIAGTAGARSVLGCLNDLALTCRLAVEDAGGLSWLDLDGLHHVCNGRSTPLAATCRRSTSSRAYRRHIRDRDP